MLETQTIGETLLPAAREVFETMIFMDLTESSDPDQELNDETVLSSITFKNNVKGCLSIRCGLDCAETITANMLGMDPDEGISQEDIGDAVGEVANMVLGSVKSRIEETVGEIQVSIPSVVFGKEMEGSLGEGMEKTCVKVHIEDEYLAELSLLYKEDE